MDTPAKEFQNFEDFYPFYLSQHANRTCRRLHFIGTTLALLLIIFAIYFQEWWLIALAVVQGYAWAWVGHYFHEHNRPATFTHPFYSFIGDWRMWLDIIRGRLKF